MTNNELAQIICTCTEILATTTTYAATFLSCDLGTEDCNAAINGMGKMGAWLDELRETIKADIQNEEQAKVHHPTTQAYEAALNHIAELKEENAKLREKLCDLWRFTKSACKKYPRLFDQSAQGGQMVQLNAIDAFEQSLQELGIEVPE